MFGYIRPFVPELKVRENEAYKGLYCGICKCLGKTVGQSARMTLSYDMVFLCLLLAAVKGETLSFTRGRCALHPLKKRPLARESESLRIAAAAGCVLFAYKIEDDRRDERGKRRLLAAAAYPLGKRQRRKALRLLPGKPDLAPAFAALAAAEKAGCGEECADCMGEILRQLFFGCEKDPVAAELLGDVGFHIGRWVYYLDAADDFAEDRKKGRFNPFSPTGPDFSRLLPALESELLAVDRLLEKLRMRDGTVKALLQNILGEGMYRESLRQKDRAQSGRTADEPADETVNETADETETPVSLLEKQTAAPDKEESHSK